VRYIQNEDMGRGEMCQLYEDYFLLFHTVQVSRVKSIPTVFDQLFLTLEIDYIHQQIVLLSDSLL
jgi:hypothetical protein